MCVFRLLALMSACGHVLSGGIYGGGKAKPHSRPFMALVEMTLPDEPLDYCAGFLLSEWFVMTAAHCEASSYKVYLGLHNMNEKEEAVIRSVDLTFPVVDFNQENVSHDIMLLKLNSKVQYNSKVRPIDLADPNDSPPKECMVFGWGRFKPNSTDLSPVLKEANVTLTLFKECQNDFFYCSRGKDGPAKGDSGCPLVCENGKVYGVMSRGTDPDKNGVRSYRYAIVSKKMTVIY